MHIFQFDKYIRWMLMAASNGKPDTCWLRFSHLLPQVTESSRD